MSEIKKRVLDAEVLMPEYRELLESGAVLPLTVSGVSMLPFLAPGRDTVYIKKIDRALKRGDIVFYQRPDGRYILHRLYRSENEECWFVGDAQDDVEGPLPEECAFAYVESVRRKGKSEKPGTFWWNFFAGAWLGLVGRRRQIMNAYAKIKSNSGAKHD